MYVRNHWWLDLTNQGLHFGRIVAWWWETDKKNLHNFRQKYRTMSNWPLLKCVSGEDGKYVLGEFHEGICEYQIGTKSLVNKVLQYRYHWPYKKEESVNLVKTCTKCQIHTNKHHILMSEYHTFSTRYLSVNRVLIFWDSSPKHLLVRTIW